MEKIIQGDCLDVLKGMPDNSVDAVVTDPPYGLSKEPDIREMLTKWMNGEDYHHRGGGFMGKSWDSFVPGPSIWREVFRVLKPGGHILCFAGTRTQDLMAISLRLAGFEIRDVIEWLYFSGFPKSMDIGKQFDKRAGAVREVIGIRKGVSVGDSPTYSGEGKCGFKKGLFDITAPATDLAKQWDGWGSALKPAHEPIIMARKPLDGSICDNVEKYGTGALNIDGCRIPYVPIPGEHWGGVNRNSTRNVYGSYKDEDGETPCSSKHEKGRFPANCITLEEDAFFSKYFNIASEPLEPAHEPIIMARKPLEGTICDNVERWGTGAINIDGCRLQEKPRKTGTKTPGDESTGTGNTYNRGAGKTRSKQIEYDQMDKGRFPANCITTEPDMFYSKYFNITPESLSKKASKKDRLSTWDGRQVEANKHPTVKPVELMAWLIRLITPPGGIVLDPFCGSGSTLVAAKREGFSFIGIEKEAEYIEIAKARVGA